jgi:hypothetical protein
MTTIMTPGFDEPDDSDQLKCIIYDNRIRARTKLVQLDKFAKIWTSMAMHGGACHKCPS